MSAVLQRVLNALRRWPKHPVDSLYGIETSQKVLRMRLNSGDKAADEANNGYAGSQPSIVRHAVAMLPPMEEAHFIDLGCGKGRVLAVATEFAFRSVVGIELSPPLHRMASRNAKRVAARHPDRTPIKAIRGDATHPALPPTGDVVLFLYNSFRAPLIATLIDYLKTAVGQRTGGRLFLIYYNPTNAALFDASDAFVRYYAERRGFAADEPMTFTNDFDSVVIWQARSSEMAAPLPGADRRVEVVIPDRAAIVQHEAEPGAGA
jgi:SAM-dependent methyltransferase